MGVQLFCMTARTVFTPVSQGMSDEQLMRRPTLAMRYCDLVRREAVCPGLPDELVLRCLVYSRKIKKMSPPG
jgi:hypothetical protein